MVRVFCCCMWGKKYTQNTMALSNNKCNYKWMHFTYHCNTVLCIRQRRQFADHMVVLLYMGFLVDYPELRSDVVYRTKTPVWLALSSRKYCRLYYTLCCVVKSKNDNIWRVKENEYANSVGRWMVAHTRCICKKRWTIIIIKEGIK